MPTLGESVRELAPHYVLLVLIILAVITGLELIYPDLSIVVQLIVALAIAMAYPFVLKKMGRAPEAWQ